MKNSFKITLLAIVVSLSFAACKGNKSGGAADSAKVDSSSSTKTTSDTSMKIDTVKPATDTSKAKMDTVSKSVSKTTEVKKSEVKKDKK